jgi:UDP-glucuronate 4-epimerase
MSVQITGTASLTGYHLARHVLEVGHQVIGPDSFSYYYDFALTDVPNSTIEGYEGLSVECVALEGAEALNTVREKAKPEIVVDLAAQSGLRRSIDHPEVYVVSNLVSTFYVLAALRRHQGKHLLAASPDLPERLTGCKPETPISVGVLAFVGWFRQRYNL